ncbi:hypothetical protein [Winogradskyella forsetii]|nr:hypothetical protein [Winogradskyella forsetii]
MFLSVLAIIGSFFIILNLIRLIDVLNGNKTNLKKLIKGTILAPIILGLFVGFVGNEFKHLGNTINDYQIFRDFGIYGLFLAIFIVLISYSFKPKEKRKISFFGLISSLIVFPLLLISSVTFINRYKAEKAINPLESIVLKKESEIDGKDKNDSQYWIFTNVGIYNEKFKIESELWNKLQKYDTLLLFMEKGNLGYEIVERIEKKPTANTVYN